MDFVWISVIRLFCAFKKKNCRTKFTIGRAVYILRLCNHRGTMSKFFSLFEVVINLTSATKCDSSGEGSLTCSSLPLRKISFVTFICFAEKSLKSNKKSHTQSNWKLKPSEIIYDSCHIV